MINSTLLLIAIGAGLRSIDFPSKSSVLITFENVSDTGIQVSTAHSNQVPLPSPTCPIGRTVGYYYGHADVRGSDKLSISSIPTEHYTDLIYSYFMINDDGYVRYANPTVDLARSGIERFVGLRGVGAVERVLLHVGDWIVPGDNYQKTFTGLNDTGTVNSRSIYEIWDRILDSIVVRNRFTFSAIRMMNRHGFDGLSIEYPWTGVSAVTDDVFRAKFLSFLKFVRGSIGYSKTLTIGPMISRLMLGSGKIVSELQDAVNYANVIVQSDPFDNFRSSHIQPKFFVRTELAKYIAVGYNASFLNLGIPMYGRGFSLTPEDYRRAKATKEFSNKLVMAWPKNFDHGSITYSRLIREYGYGESHYVLDEGSWLTIDSENSIIGYIDVPDVQELMVIFKLYRLGGITIDSIDHDVYDNLNRNIVRVVHKC